MLRDRARRKAADPNPAAGSRLAPNSGRSSRRVRPSSVRNSGRGPNERPWTQGMPAALKTSLRARAPFRGAVTRRHRSARTRVVDGSELGGNAMAILLRLAAVAVIGLGLADCAVASPLAAASKAGGLEQLDCPLTLAAVQPGVDRCRRFRQRVCRRHCHWENGRRHCQVRCHRRIVTRCVPDAKEMRPRPHGVEPVAPRKVDTGAKRDDGTSKARSFGIRSETPSGRSLDTATQPASRGGSPPDAGTAGSRDDAKRTRGFDRGFEIRPLNSPVPSSSRPK